MLEHSNSHNSGPQTNPLSALTFGAAKWVAAGYAAAVLLTGCVPADPNDPGYTATESVNGTFHFPSRDFAGSLSRFRAHNPDLRINSVVVSDKSKYNFDEFTVLTDRGESNSIARADTANLPVGMESHGNGVFTLKKSQDWTSVLETFKQSNDHLKVTTVSPLDCSGFRVTEFIVVADPVPR